MKASIVNDIISKINEHMPQLKIAAKNLKEVLDQR